MKISTEQLEKVAASPPMVAPGDARVDDAVIRLTDRDMVLRLTQEVLAMPDREEMVQEVKARVDAGQYHVSSDEIVDAMARRTIADRVR